MGSTRKGRKVEKVGGRIWKVPASLWRYFEGGERRESGASTKKKGFLSCLPLLFYLSFAFSKKKKKFPAYLRVEKDEDSTRFHILKLQL